MKRILFSIVLLLMASASLVYAQTAAELIKAGDEFYAKYDDDSALLQYEQAAKLEPTNYEALWKTARAYFDISDKIPEDDKSVRDKAIKLYMSAEDYSKKAVAANPNDTWGHFFLSASLGKHALLLGKKEQINMSKQIKAEIEKAIELDANNDLAYHALGRWHRRMAEIGGVQRFFGGIIYGSIPKGTFEEAEKNFKKAIEINPTYGNHHLELGRTYVAMKKKDLAANEFQLAIDAPPQSSKCEMNATEAKAELAKLKK